MSESTTGQDNQVTGRLLESSDGMIVLGIPGSDYELHLVPAGEVSPGSLRRVNGVIRARAKRVDVVSTGGRFIEPVMGRPRRVQGRVIDTDPDAGTITVAAGVAVTAHLDDPRQSAADFDPGQLVAFDVMRGATFEPA